MVRNSAGEWISKIWGCKDCGHLFRLHDIYWGGRRCQDIVDRKKRI